MIVCRTQRALRISRSAAGPSHAPRWYDANRRARGSHKGRGACFLSEPITAELMAQWNVVSRVVDDGDLKTGVGFGSATRRRTSARLCSDEKAAAYLVRGGQKSARAMLYDISMPLFDTQDVQTALRNAAAAANAGQSLPGSQLYGTMTYIRVRCLSLRLARPR